MSLYILGGSVTGGGGVRNASDAWTNLVGNNNLLFYKNAIEPNYFLHCLNRFKPLTAKRFRAIVLDFGPNMWSANSALHLALLANRSRRLINVSDVLLIAWSRKRQVSDLQKVFWAAHHSNSVVINVTIKDDMYADNVHPNTIGHRAIADAVHSFLHTNNPTPSSYFSHEIPIHEQCFDDARKIPIVHAGYGWSLVDDGRKNIHKFGWRILNGNGTLTFDIELKQCNHVITLGYLRTNYEKGYFNIKCGTDCKCSTIRGWHQRKVNPFPTVYTHTMQRIRVTDTTMFGIVSNSSKCQIHINGRHARIDSMYNRIATSKDIKNAAHSNRKEHKQFVHCNK